MKQRLNFRSVVFAILVLAFVIALPWSVRYAFQHGGFYLFSDAFLQDLPKRLTGPGRMRFILQPAVAIFLGIRAGKADARGGKPAYILGLVLGYGNRISMLKEAFAQLSTLVAVAILLDCISQFLILRAVYFGAAVVVGPVLIAVPYSLGRALSNRWMQIRQRVR